MPRPRSIDSRAEAARIQADSDMTAAAKAWRRAMLSFGRDKLSRRRFLESLTIQDKRTGQFVQWRLNGPQRHIEAMRLRTKRAGRLERYAILKARKLGSSIYWIGDGIEAAQRVSGMQMGIIGQHNPAATALLHQLKQIYEREPELLRAIVTRFNNRTQLYFSKPLDSSIDIFSAKTDDPMRGRTMRKVHCTEPQMWEGDVLKKRAAIENAVADDDSTCISYEGTGFGRNWWHDFYFSAARGENAFQALFLSWLLDPKFDYSIPVTPDEVNVILASLTANEEKLRLRGATWGQLAWRRVKIATSFSGDENLFAQEYPSSPEEAFLSDGRPAFNALAIDRKLERCTKPEWSGDIDVLKLIEGEYEISHRLVQDPRGALSIWRMPEPGHEYVVGTDAGHGLGQDNSVACVLDVQTGEQVAEWCYNRVEPRPFGMKAIAIADFYNRATIMPEIEGPGAGVLEALKSFCYPNVGTRDVFDSRGKVAGQKLGFSTNGKSRPVVFNELRWAISGESDVKPRSAALCREMYPMYVDPTGKEDTPIGKHDDRVIAFGVALIARRQVKPSTTTRPVDYELPEGSLEERHWREFEASVAPRDEDETETWTTDSWN